jgi:hypothetical protein
MNYDVADRHILAMHSMKTKLQVWLGLSCSYLIRGLVLVRADTYQPRLHRMQPCAK